jgi:hypothetical protein
MTESNKTHSDLTHRIFIASPKPTADRTGLYIITLLCVLFFILIFYLVYNFISFKRYSSSLRKNKTKAYLYLYSENHLSTETKLKNHSDPYEELTIELEKIHQCLKQSSSDQHQMTRQLVSDL